MKFRVYVEREADKYRIMLFPRSKKTTFFPSKEAAETAADRFGRKMGAGWRAILADTEGNTVNMAI